MAARTHKTGDDQWLVSCVECDWLQRDEDAANYETAEHTAAAHNSEHHTQLERPEWWVVSEWADAHRAELTA